MRGRRAREEIDMPKVPRRGGTRQPRSKRRRGRNKYYPSADSVQAISLSVPERAWGLLTLAVRLRLGEGVAVAPITPHELHTLARQLGTHPKSAHQELAGRASMKSDLRLLSACLYLVFIAMNLDRMTQAARDVIAAARAREPGWEQKALAVFGINILTERAGNPAIQQLQAVLRGPVGAGEGRGRFPLVDEPLLLGTSWRHPSNRASMSRR